MKMIRREMCLLFHQTDIQREIVRCLKILSSVEGSRFNGLKIRGTSYEELNMWAMNYYFVDKEPIMKMILKVF